MTDITIEAASPYELRVDLAENTSENDVAEALASGDMGFLHSFTTGSAVDGPGVRVVAWTTGCMWRCQYCHNPDTWKLKNGFPVTVGRAMAQLSRYRHSLKIMSGGVTISGGEPLMQDRFVVKVLAGAHQLGIHTAIETNGFFGSRLSDAELGTIDLVMYGLKTWDPERHRALTSQDIAPTLEFAQRLSALRKPAWIRFVLVPGLTDDPEDIANIARFAAKMGNVQRVEVLPFHQLGRYKWERLGLNYSLAKAEPPTPEAVANAIEIFRAEGLAAD